jgi:hypothetical protein
LSLADTALENPFADSNALFVSSSSLASSLTVDPPSSSATPFGLVLSRSYTSNTDQGWDTHSEMDANTSTVSAADLTLFVYRINEFNSPDAPQLNW